MGEKKNTAAKCFICKRPKPLLFGGFIQCNNCGRIFCPECLKKFVHIGGYSSKPKPIRTRCPKCKRIGLHKV